MNCLQARQQFASFWRKAQLADDRRTFLAHLEGCPACDRAFRGFALTAPVLYRDLKNSAARVVGRPSFRPAALRLEGGERTFRPSPRLAVPLAMAIGAAVAVFMAAPRRITFEDAIVGYPGVARLTYSPTENLFWPNGSGPQTSRPDPEQTAPTRGEHPHLAG